MEIALVVVRLIVRVDLWIASAILLAGLFSSTKFGRGGYRLGMLVDGIGTVMQMVVSHRFSIWQKTGLFSTFVLSWIACDFLSLTGDFVVLTVSYIVYYVSLAWGITHLGRTGPFLANKLGGNKVSKRHFLLLQTIWLI